MSFVFKYFVRFMFSLKKIVCLPFPRHPQLMDKAIRRALSNRKVRFDRSGTTSGSGLTPQDHFYCQISRVEDIVSGLQAVQDESLNTESPRDVVNTIKSVNKLLIVSSPLVL